jgi:heptosyltransferase-2
MATAVGVPTIAIFCPIIPCSPKRWGPTGNGHTIIVPDVPSCKKCIKEKCPHWDCMENIKVDDVLIKINSIIYS